METIDQLNDEQVANWEELSTPSITTLHIGNGKYVQHLSFVPFDKLIEFQAKHGLGTPHNRDLLGYMIEILKYVMVKPKIASPEEARAAAKGNSTLLLGIIESVASKKDAEEIREQLGKS